MLLPRQCRLFLFTLSLVAGSAAAQYQAVKLHNADERPRLDGVLQDDIWKRAVRFDRFYQTQPVDGVDAHVRTEVMLAYDDAYLYIGVNVLDPHPDDIRAPLSLRDKASADQDFVGLFLDPSGSAKSAQVFYVNAAGALTDGIFSDTNGDDNSPDFQFEAATARTPAGWSAEFRIPFSSVAYALEPGRPWRLLVMRNLTREQRYRIYSAPVALGSGCILCAAMPIEGLTDLPTGVNWTATPQVAINRGYAQTGTAARQTFRSVEPSLDIKIRPDSASVIDVTLNPDFSQVELDEPQLSGNTRYGIFTQEKRPFFLEGRDILQTPLAAVNTRAMTAPSWGARYTRRGSRAIWCC